MSGATLAGAIVFGFLGAFAVRAGTSVLDDPENADDPQELRFGRFCRRLGWSFLAIRSLPRDGGRMKRVILPPDPSVVMHAMADRVPPSRGDPLLDIHTAGAKRHPSVWLAANEAAVHAARRQRFDYSKLENKLLLSEVVLRVLDASRPKQKPPRKP